MMLSKAYFDATGPQGLQDRMVGTGPYQFVERKPGESVIFERVAYEHYRVTPEFPEVEVRNIVRPQRAGAPRKWGHPPDPAPLGP